MFFSFGLATFCFVFLLRACLNEAKLWKMSEIKTGKQRLIKRCKKIGENLITDPHSHYDYVIVNWLSNHETSGQNPSRRSLMDDSTEPDYSPRCFLAPHHCLSLTPDTLGDGVVVRSGNKMQKLKKNVVIRKNNNTSNGLLVIFDRISHFPDAIALSVCACVFACSEKFLLRLLSN